MEMMFERARLTLKIHPEFNSLSAANQEFILTRNQYAALALSVIQVKTNIASIIVERVTKIENIKTDSTKILRPTHFSGSKDIKTDRLFFCLIL
jgi:hypothetical protein